VGHDITRISPKIGPQKLQNFFVAGGTLSQGGGEHIFHDSAHTVRKSDTITEEKSKAEQRRLF